MDMEMSFSHISLPLWYRLSVVAAAIFAVAGRSLARRSSHPFFVIALPLALVATLSYRGDAEVATGLSLYGGGRAAASAGCAEATFALAYGFIVAAFVALLGSIFPLREPFQELRIGVALSVGTVLTTLVAGHIVVTQHLTRAGQAYDPDVVSIARAGAVVSFALFLALIVLAFRKKPRPATVSRVAMIFSTAVLIASTVALWELASSYREIALGR